MVRIKHRYLLVNILYPELDGKPIDPTLPNVVQFHQPTTDGVLERDLIRGIKEEVDFMFGDYGAGAISDSNVKYWSPATSTFIVRVSREHYRLVWAALSLMDRVPVKNGKKCVFRIVRVSGTIRKSQEEVIRRAREIILIARQEQGEQSGSTLENIFGKGVNHSEADPANDVLMVDKSDDEEDDSSDG